MLMTHTQRDVETFGVGETAEFTIKANGKAFKVLIDGLYSDKIRAVTREIWSNAFDSHIAAGKPEGAFDCHLPTKWDPYFSVRDYGTSLSHDQVMHLYTTVFASSKENTNTQVGKLGLGSKSPFAYTDTFTVTAWMDGVRRTYSAYIGPDYIPRISLMGEEASDEATGLEISFPVNAKDIYEFHTAAKRTALGFDVLPNIIGSDPLKKATAETLLEGKGWKIFRTTEYGIGGHAKQGCVVYPIDENAVGGLSDVQRDILNSAIFIDFPIGDLEITASREGLGYDSQTCANIRARIEVIEREIEVQLVARVQTLTSYREVLKWMHDLKNSQLPHVVYKTAQKLTWRGRPVTESIYVNPSKNRMSLVRIDNRAFQYKKIEGHISSGPFYMTPGVLVYVHDTSKPVPGMYARIRADYTNRPNFHSGAVLLRAEPGSMAYKRAMVALGRPLDSEIVDVSTLPAAQSKSYGYVRTKVKARLFSPFASKIAGMDQVDVTAEDGGIYVMAERGELIGPKGVECSIYDVSKVLSQLRKIGILTEKDHLYIIPKTLTRISKGEGWTDLWTLAKETLDQNFDAEKINRLAQLRTFLIPSAHEYSVTEVLKHIAKTTQVTFSIGQAYEVTETVRTLHKEYLDLVWISAYEELWKYYSNRSQLPEPTVINPLPVFSQAKLAKAYPLIAAMSKGMSWASITDDAVTKNIIDYIDLIDMQP